MPAIFAVQLQTMSKETIKSYLQMSMMASLTLGLAPFFPEPHILGKLKWIWGGGHGMKLMDYMDLLMHGTPWLALIILTITYFFYNFKNNKNEHSGHLKRG